MISSDSFNVMIYIIIFFLYFEFSNLGEEIVKWFASNNIISIKLLLEIIFIDYFYKQFNVTKSN